MRPDPTVQKILLSSPARFVGEYEDQGLLITHAWPQGEEMHRALHEGPYSQSYYVAAFRTKSVPHNQVPVPDYSHEGYFIASILSLLYGKRFDSHGPIESIGLFQVPRNIVRHALSKSYLLPFNHRPRVSDGVELNLNQVSRIRTLFEEDLDCAAEQSLLHASCRFYARALTLWGDQPELAFMDLITCGEIICSSVTLEDDELYDEELRQLLQQIASLTPDGPRLSDEIKNRLYQVRRRFVRGLSRLIDKSFFECSEVCSEWGRLREDDIEARLRAAYDLRSKYVHTGKHFGQFVASASAYNEEVPLGEWKGGDGEMARLASRSPNLIGIERIMRHCILQRARMAGFLKDSPQLASGT